MNFLAHYYFDRSPDEPYQNLGLLFPDLFRNYIKGGRLKINQLKAISPEHDQLIQGCIKHVSSDKIFHNWHGFHELMEDVTYELRSNSVSIGKDWFIAHILVELVLDQYLTRAYPSLAKELYTSFSALEMKTLGSFFDTNELANFEMFELGLNRFMEIRYLEKYHETASILYALGRICTKVNLPAFTQRQEQVLLETCHLLLSKMPVKLIELEAQLS